MLGRPGRGNELLLIEKLAAEFELCPNASGTLGADAVALHAAG